jgi:hypothetical protein
MQKHVKTGLRFFSCTLVACLVFGPQVSSQDQQEPRITRIEFRAASQEEGGGMIISLLGAGQCTYTIDFGDGKSETRTAKLPDRLQHTYPADGEYDVVATPQPPCQGTARAKISMRSIDRGIWGINAEAGPSTEALELIITIRGQGQCSVNLELGDGNSQKFDATLPTTRTHKYANAGVYHLKATTVEPCRGMAEMKAEIKRR